MSGRVHWSESDKADLIRDVFDSLPPRTWDVAILVESGFYHRGRIDAADAHLLISEILNVMES